TRDERKRSLQGFLAGRPGDQRPAPSGGGDHVAGRDGRELPPPAKRVAATGAAGRRTRPQPSHLARACQSSERDSLAPWCPGCPGCPGKNAPLSATGHLFRVAAPAGYFFAVFASNLTNARTSWTAGAGPTACHFP